MAVTINGTTGITTPDVNVSDELTITDGTATHTISTDSFNNLTLYSDQSTSEYINYKGGIGHTFRVGDTSVTDTSGSEAMRIDSSGSLLVGATNNTFSGRLAVAYAGTGSSTKGIAVITLASPGTKYMQFINSGGGEAGHILHSGSNSVQYNSGSDYRLKENVVDLTDAIDRVKQLNVYRFNFIDEPDRVVDGFIAHEAQEVVPEAVSGTKDAMQIQDIYDEEGNVIGTQEVPDYQGIDQAKLVPLLTAALQEAIAEIESLKARVEALETV
jgi:hypothetical protein